MINDDLDDSVQSYDDVILWLWKAHNNVNDRLRGEQSSDFWTSLSFFLVIVSRYSLVILITLRLFGSQPYYFHCPLKISFYFTNVITPSLNSLLSHYSPIILISLILFQLISYYQL